jgi:hypothetical protein
MNYTFKNGAKVEGTIDQINLIAKSLKETINPKNLGGDAPKGYYISSTRGIIKISEMQDIHLRNALLKQSKTYFETLQKEKGLKNTDFCSKYVGLTDKTLVIELYTELSKRKS